MKRGLILLLALLLVLFQASVEAESSDAATWVYEGRLDHVDGALVPELKSGWVLSGSFLYDAARMRPDMDAAAAGRTRYAGGIEGAEATVDLYYQLKTSALQGDGPAGYDWMADEADASSQIHFFIPLKGALEGTDWTLRWLQLVLRGAWGEASPTVLKSGFTWDSGYFRLIYGDSDGASAEAWGALTLFGRSGEAELKESATWEAALTDLARSLESRDATIISLEEALAQTRSKVAALQAMLDLMAGQRLELEAENERLEERLQAWPEEERSRQAGEAAERALLTEALANAETRNVALVAQVEAMTTHAASLQLRLDALAAEAPAIPQPALVEQDAEGPAEEARSEGMRSEASAVLVRTPPTASPPAVSAKGPLAEAAATERPERRLGPSKFR